VKVRRKTEEPSTQRRTKARHDPAALRAVQEELGQEGSQRSSRPRRGDPPPSYAERSTYLGFGADLLCMLVPLLSTYLGFGVDLLCVEVSTRLEWINRLVSSQCITYFHRFSFEQV
jgi:hypothetical protein